MKVALSGGAPQRIASIAGYPVGVSWGPDDAIVYSDNSSRGLRSVIATGGAPVQLTSADPAEGVFVAHHYPHHLPDGEHVLFTIGTGEMESLRVAVLALSTGEITDLGVRGQSPQYVQSVVAGYLVYGQALASWPCRSTWPRSPYPACLWRSSRLCMCRAPGECSCPVAATARLSTRRHWAPA